MAFKTSLKSIESDSTQTGSSSASLRDNIADFPDVRDLQLSLRELNTTTKQTAVALYTLVGDDGFHLILITGEGTPRNFKSPVKADDLNRKVVQMYALLQSPTYDPRPLARELYDIIFKPLEAELKSSGVQTLMWQLDGNLRYLPMAALFDGEKFLVERFQNVVFTRADKERMTRAVSTNWTGTGFGSSRSRVVDSLDDGATVTFEALPGVTAELASIFRSQISLNNQGLLDGDVFTDARFTKDVFYTAVKQRRPLVHIASHFASRPGDDTQSFLLMGDGSTLTLNELKKQTRLFEGVELLTLSACNTALQRAESNGREIDGFSEIAQRLGAGAVMATLWAVADNSTPWLMREFYQTRQSGRGLTKATSLRQAQLALLSGQAKTHPLPEAQKGPSLPNIVIRKKDEHDNADTRSSEVIRVDEKDAPLFRRDEKKPFSHPYYWAPFILIGNWK